jgi:DNA-binding transcriptional ArsR family regulator
MVETQLEALAVDTRRAIYQLLLERPRSVGELAAELPVSRPAVSQHLKVLVEARLARQAKLGNRHVYSADPEGMGALRGWVDQMWEMALGSFAGFAAREMEREMEQKTSARIEPVVKTITVPGSPSQAFDLFTNRIDEWWPKLTHSVAGERAARVLVEPGVGGRIYEITDEGLEHPWGEITVWEQDERIALTWHPGLPTAQSTSLDLGFQADGAATRVTLVHDGWEMRGVNGLEMRDNYDTGWDHVLGMIPEVTLTA